MRIGDELTPFTRRTDLANFNRYAAVNDEFLAHSMDDAAARSEGFPQAFGMGNLQWSYLHSFLRQSVGPDGRILQLDVQFRNPNLRGQTLTAKGKVIAVDDGVAQIELWTQSDDGSRLAIGSARVVAHG